MCTIPGLTLITKSRKFEKYVSKSFEYKYIFGAIISILFITLTSVLYMFTRFEAVFWIYLAIFFLSLFYFWQNKMYLHFLQNKDVLFLQMLALLVSLAYQGFRDHLFLLNNFELYWDTVRYLPFSNGYYGYHGDNTLIWGISRVFLHGFDVFSNTADLLRLGWNGFSTFDRTPLLQVTLVSVLGIFGESHFIFQRFITVLMSFYFVVVYLLAKEFGNGKIAKVLTLLLIINPIMHLQIFNVEIYYKYFAIFPVLLACIFVVKYEKIFISGLLLLFGLLIHPMVLVFFPVLGIYLLYRYKISGVFVKNGFLLFTFGTAAYALWLLFSARFEAFNASGLVKNNIYFNKLENTGNQSFLSLFWLRVVNFLNVFVPDLRHEVVSVDEIKKAYFPFAMRVSLLSAITPLIFVYAFLKARIKDYKENFILLFFGFFPFVIYLLMHNQYNKGGTTLVYHFCVPFILLFILPIVFKAKKWLRFVLFSSVVLWDLLGFYLISGVFSSVNYVDFTTARIQLLNIALFIYIVYLIYKETINYDSN